ncbi:hypothetical protein EFS38_20455, partial [Dickeya undicola]
RSCADFAIILRVTIFRTISGLFFVIIITFLIFMNAGMPMCLPHIAVPDIPSSDKERHSGTGKDSTR